MFPANKSGNRRSVESNVIVMGLTSMLANFGNALWFYFLPIYYSEVFGATPVQITIIFAVWSAIAALGSAPAGALADSIGRKKVIVISSLISSFSILIFAFSHSFLISAVALPLSGLGSSFFRVSNTLVAESVEESRRASAFGTYQALGGIAAAISPIVGGVTITGSGYFPLFIIGAVFTLIAAFARLFLLKETLSEETRIKIRIRESTVSSFMRNFRRAFTNRTFFALVLIYSLYNLIVEQNSPITSLYARSVLGFDLTNLGILFSAILLILAVSRFGFGRLADRIGLKKTVIISWVGEITFVYAFVFAPRGMPTLAILGMTFWMLFGVMDGPAINAWISELAPSQKTRGFSMGVFYTTTIIPTVPALVLSGYLFSIQPQFPFYANTVLGAIALAILIGIPRRHKTLDKVQI
ncbi:MAG: MFS transporter [Nitrososphaerales archaeon]